MIKIMAAILAIFLSACAPIIKSNPARLAKDLLIYERAKECKSEKLDLVIYARRPIENPEEEIWVEDIRIDMLLRREDETITITRYHNIELTATGKVIWRTFYDFPDMQLIDENLEWKTKRPTPEELQTIFKDILSTREIYPYELEYFSELKKELQSEYGKVVEKCLWSDY